MLKKWTIVICVISSCFLGRQVVKTVGLRQGQQTTIFAATGSLFVLFYSLKDWRKQTKIFVYNVELKEKGVTACKGRESACKACEYACKGLESACNGHECACKGRGRACKGSKRACKGLESSRKGPEVIVMAVRMFLESMRMLVHPPLKVLVKAMYRPWVCYYITWKWL